MNAPTLAQLKVKLFTDGADKAQIVEMARQPWIAGFTTNPSLLRKAGVADYAAYARELVAAVPDRHISFEVFSDDVAEMVAQARVIASWGKNVYVKLPVTNTRGEPLFEAVRTLSREGVKINMTAIFTGEQVARAIEALSGDAPACVSVFAGRPRGLRDLTIGRSCRMPLRGRARRATSRSSGLRRAKSSTLWKRMRWAATSSRRRPTFSKSFPRWAQKRPPSFRSPRSNPSAMTPSQPAYGCRFPRRALQNRRCCTIYALVICSLVTV